MKNLKLISDSSEIEEKDYDVIYYNETSKEVTLKLGATTPTVETVDLGLPSGTKWMKYNIGSTTEEGYGKYFQWGDTVGYEDASHSTWATAPFNNGSSSYDGDYFNSVSGTVCPDGVLATNYDAAYVATDGAAHMPTKTQWKELTANTTTAWTQVNSVDGIKFSASNGNYVFFPAAGFAYDGSLYDQGNRTSVWSSSLNTGNPDNAWVMNARSDGMSVLDRGSRYFGYSVRGVVG